MLLYSLHSFYFLTHLLHLLCLLFQLILKPVNLVNAVRCLKLLPHLLHLLLQPLELPRSFFNLLVFVLQSRISLQLRLNLGPTLFFKLADLRIHLGNHIEQLLLKLLVYLHHALY